MMPLVPPSTWLALFSAGGTPSSTETSSTAREREDVELASWLEMLESYELLVDMEMLELLPVLEESHD
jgi:hypothetical protein